MADSIKAAHKTYGGCSMKREVEIIAMLESVGGYALEVGVCVVSFAALGFGTVFVFSLLSGAN